MDELVRKLEIAFEDSISLDKRRQLIDSNKTTEEIFDNLEKIPKTEEAKDCASWLENGYGEAIWYTDVDFPDYRPVERRLPYVLFYKGRRPEKKPRITIVGTRFASEDALQRAFSLGFEAQVNEISVVSGMAQGIDQAAARGALSGVNVGCGCSVIGILGCGLEVDYPVMSGPLKTRIIENGGTLISQFSPSEPGLKQNFPNRNLTLSAMGDSCVVVQAPDKSGSLITADYSLQMGKDVFVTDAGIEQISRNKGSIELMEQGATVIKSLGDVYYIKRTVVRTDTPKRPFARYGQYNYTVKTLT